MYMNVTTRVRSLESCLSIMLRVVMLRLAGCSCQTATDLSCLLRNGAAHGVIPDS